jgi:uncharacterized protein (DUF924 family)
MRAAAAAAALLAAAALALLAHDLRAQRSVATPGTVLPAAMSERLLDLGPQRRLRDAVRLYERSRTDARLRPAAERALAAAAQDGDPRRASQAYDLLALLAFRHAGATAADEAVSELQTAVRLDPANDAAKANLELVLRLERAGGARPGQAATAGPRAQGAQGAGSAGAGGGY